MDQIYKYLGQHTIILTMLLLPGAAFPDQPNQGQKLSQPNHQSEAVKRSSNIPEQRRLLPIENTRNTRDLGGYSTVDGRRVKWGILFRSDNLASLNEPDLRYLAKLQLAAVTDLRSDSERT